MKYINQLDSLRGIAVLFVIVHHWKPEINLNRFSIGAIGVDMFFVLSGFLISTILLTVREKSKKNNTPIKNLFRSFYFRRMLRIFPIYYMAILFALIFKNKINYYTDLETLTPYLLSFSVNFFYYIGQSWGGLFSHFWSIAVEEQFYLIWPWILIFFNKKILPYIIGLLILIGILTQFLILEQNNFTPILTITCFDAFGLGGLLAYIFIYYPQKLSPIFKTSLCISIAVFILFLIYHFDSFRILNWSKFPTRTTTSIITFSIISYLILNKEKPENLRLKIIFNNSSLIWIGKISYGIYIFHHFVPEIFGPYLFNENYIMPKKLHFSFQYGLMIASYFLITLIISYLSYTIVEQPFLRLKKYFSYQQIIPKTPFSSSSHY